MDEDYKSCLTPLVPGRVIYLCVLKRSLRPVPETSSACTVEILKMAYLIFYT